MHSVQKKWEKEINELTAACTRVAQRGFVTSHGGNLSCRVDNDTVLITPTKVPKGNITFDDIVIVSMSGETVFAAEGRKHTGELPFHLGVFRDRPDCNAIVHTHPPEITGMAIAHSNLLSRPLLPEPLFEVGPMLDVEYATPLSDQLADNFKAVIKKSNAFLMKNHGMLLCSPAGITRAVELTEMMEATAASARVAVALGGVKEMSVEDVADMENVMNIRGMPMPGLPGEVTSLVEMFFPDSKIDITRLVAEQVA